MAGVTAASDDGVTPGGGLGGRNSGYVEASHGDFDVGGQAGADARRVDEDAERVGCGLDVRGQGDAVAGDEVTEAGGDGSGLSPARMEQMGSPKSPTAAP
jgi:hypothetical protein